MISGTAPKVGKTQNGQLAQLVERLPYRSQVPVLYYSTKPLLAERYYVFRLAATENPKRAQDGQPVAQLEQPLAGAPRAAHAGRPEVSQQIARRPATKRYPM